MYRSVKFCKLRCCALFVCYALAVTTCEDGAVDSRLAARPRRARPPGQAPGPASTKRFPQFPPGATAAAAKAARAGDVVADHQRSVSLPVLSGKASASITTSVSNVAITSTSDDLSVRHQHHQQQQSSPRDQGQRLQITRLTSSDLISSDPMSSALSAL